MKLAHYSDRHVTAVHSVAQIASRSAFHKPCGLWLSVEGDGEGWREWCLDNDFALNRLTHVHDVELAHKANILLLKSANCIDDFTRDFGRRLRNIPMKWIDWTKVALSYSGVIISPYVYARRFDDRASWYYGWDCASGCIWDAAAIERITLREVVSAEPIAA